MTKTENTSALSNEKSFNELVKKYEKLITKFAYKFTITNFSRDDIEQEILTVLWETTKTYDESRGAFITYFYKVVNNHLLALTYKNKEVTYLDTDVYDLDRQNMFSTDEDIEKQDRQQVISDMIWDYLATHRYGKIMKWHYIGKMSIKRIAEIEKRTINTIQQRFYRTYDDIRSDLGIDNLRDYFE